jgi:NADPH2:quinone reductase
MTKIKSIGLHKYLPISDNESFVEDFTLKPTPKNKEILVKIIAVSVNPADTKIRSPKNKIEKDLRILGWDAVGTVEELGTDAKMFKVGDIVYYSGDVPGAGSNREYATVDERIVALAPKKMKPEHSAGFPLVTITAYEGLFDRLKISKNKIDNKDKYVLIIGGAGGVGSIAIQLAKKIAGIKVIATASKKESIEWCKKMGADIIINHHTSMLEQIKLLGINYVDYILCLNSTEKHFAEMVAIAKPQSIICTIVESKELLDVSLLHAKSLSLVYEFMSTRPKFNTEDIIEQHNILKTVANLIDNAEIQNITTKVLNGLNANNLKLAHKIVEEGSMIGKITLTGNWW